ncbi:MAG: hypothetical protein ABI851_15910 [Saprospiraceae bacterium]
MGHIKEPPGVDFVIKSRPLTKDEEIGISEYIRAYKIKHSKKKDSATPTKDTTTKRRKVIA